MRRGSQRPHGRERLRRVSAVGRPLGRGLVHLRNGVSSRVQGIPGRLWLLEAMDRSRRDAVAGLSPEAALHARSNFRLGVANGIIYGLADSLIAPGFVLALFVNRLGAPNILVGLIPAIATGGGFLPQILVASRVQSRSRMMPLYRGIAAIRVAALILMTVATLTLSATPALLLVAFFLFYTVYTFGSRRLGHSLAGDDKQSDIAPKAWLILQPAQLLGRGTGSARLGSGCRCAFREGLGPDFPLQLRGDLRDGDRACRGRRHSYVADQRAPGNPAREACHAARYTSPGARSGKDRPGVQVFHDRPRAARPGHDRRSLLCCLRQNPPGGPAATVGLYLGASAAASLASNFVWGPVGDRAGNRFIMTLTVFAVSSVPLAALIIPMLAGTIGTDGVILLFTLVFVLGGLAAGSGRILANNMLLAIAPPFERATYIGFLNTFLGIVTFVPLVGGALVDAVGFVPLFVVTVLIAASALPASLRMSNRHLTS